MERSASRFGRLSGASLGCGRLWLHCGSFRATLSSYWSWKSDEILWAKARMPYHLILVASVWPAMHQLDRVVEAWASFDSKPLRE